MKNIFKVFRKRVVSIFVLVTIFVSNFSNVVVFGEDAVAVGGSFNLSIDKLSDSNGRSDLSLDWDDVNFQGKEDGTRYYVFRKDLSTGKWEGRGRYGDDIKVLNIYPDIAGSDGLKSWMDALAVVNKNVRIDVETVKISKFNTNPNDYLYKNPFGNYNYDVVVFGFWDSNNKLDLSSDSVTVVEDFIDNDGGVIFGHDTIETTKAGVKPYFRRVVEGKTSIKASAAPGATWPNWLYSYKIKVQKQGSATTYPCDINGMSLIIPYSHTIGQIPTNPDAVYMGFEKYSKQEVKAADPSLDISIDQYKSADGTTDNTDLHYLNYIYNGTTDRQTAQDDVYLNYGGVSYNTNAYLTLEENVAFIQCGHSSGKTNTAEQMILANTIYALAKIHTGTQAPDQILDTTPPAIPTRDVNGNLIGFNSTDEGNSYEYRVVAIPMGVEESVRKNSAEIIAALDVDGSTGIGEHIKFSNSVKTTVEGGLQKFRYYIDKNPTGTVAVDHTSLAIDGTIDVPANSSKDTFVHVAAYDLANNVSGTYSFNLWDAVQFYNVTEKFIDVNTGLEFQPEKLSLKLNGSTYTPSPEKTITISDILTYEYVDSDPTNIVVKEDESLNVITHYYKTTDSTSVTERYIANIRDVNGNIIEERVIKSPITSNVKVGTLYTPVITPEQTITVSDRLSYEYVNSNPTNIVASDDESLNVITHYYEAINSAFVTERYIAVIKDTNGNILEEKVVKTPLTSNVKVGTLYAPTTTPEQTITVSDRLSYEYVNSDSTNIVVSNDDNLNIITHYYKVINTALVTERYIANVRDVNGNVIEERVIKAPLTFSITEGTIYTPQADVYNKDSIVQENGVDKYLFLNTDLSKLTVSSDETKNVITHYYDVLLTKTINVVEHITYPTSSTLTYPFDQDIVLKQGTNMDISLPILSNHNFDGYYTIGTPEVNADGSNKVEVGNDKININLTWLDEEPIYVHYTRKVGRGTVKIVNSVTKFTITSFETPESNVGENLIITDDYTAKMTSGVDFSTYTDSYKLKEFLVVPITNEGNNNVLTVELTPKEKTIIYYGIEIIQNVVRLIGNIFSFDGDTTNSNISNFPNTTTNSAVDVTSSPVVSETTQTLQAPVQTSIVTSGETTNLGSDTYTYGVAKGNYNGKDTQFNLIDKMFDGWSIFDNSKNFLVNFSDPTTTSYVGYYRFPKLEETYTYEVNYLNDYGDTALVGKQDTTTSNVFDKPIINIKQINNLNINGNSVDFEPAYIEISHPTLGTQTFNFTDDYLSFFNKQDSTGNYIQGHYVVNIYYKPYVTINYVEEFLHTDLVTVINTRSTTFKVLYDETQTLPYPQTKFSYEYLLYKLNGAEVDHSKPYPRLLANQYSQTVTATYRPVVYNLNVKAYTVGVNPNAKTLKSSRALSSPSESYYVSYQFNNVPAIDTIAITEPKFEGFSFQGLLGGDNLNMSNTNGVVSIKADPQKVLTTMLSGYVPNYGVDAIYNKPSVLTVNHIDTATNTPFKTETITSVVGTDTKISVYSDNTRQYNNTIVVGGSQTVVFANNQITVKPTLETQTVNVYYIDGVKYNLNVTSNVGGSTTGSNTGAYFKDANISVTATATTGYEFEKWEITGITGLNTTSTTLTFNMPTNTVTLNAVFKEVTVSGGGNTGGGNTGGGNTGGGTNANTKSNNTEATTPATTPELSYWEYERLYKPYITGYPDGSMHPNSNITRSEFIAIVYNLLGEEEKTDLIVLNKFSDVNPKSWYAQALAFTVEHNYISGYEDGTFRPNSEMTRAELVAVIARLLKDDGTKPVVTPFTDIENSWAKNSIVKLYSRGFIAGTTESKFNPNDDATRAEVVTLVNRLIKRPTNWKQDKTYPDLKPEHWAYSDMMNAANGNSLYDQKYSEGLKNK